MRKTALPVCTLQYHETISSLLERAASLFNITGDEFGSLCLNRWGVDHPGSPRGVADWDDPPDNVIDMLVATCGTTQRRQILRARINDGIRWLDPVTRRAWCPRCFANDLANGATPYFRKEWARAAITFCNAHKLPQPLLLWPYYPPASRLRRIHRHRTLPAELMTERWVVPTKFLTDNYKLRNFPLTASSLTTNHVTRDAPYVVLKTQEAKEYECRKYEALANLPEDLLSAGRKLSLWEQDLDRHLRCAQRDAGQHIKHTQKAAPLNETERRLALLGQIAEQGGELIPSLDGWYQKTHNYSAVAQPEGPEALTRPLIYQLWNEFRGWGNPAERRALFWSAARVEDESHDELCTLVEAKGWSCVLVLGRHQRSLDDLLRGEEE